MANFVTDNTPLPPLKSDAHPPINPTIEVDAADINGLWAALADVRGVLATEQPVNFVAPFTGAVARTIPSKLAEIVSVKDFGAKGDGIADDAAAINAAIVAATNKTLFFPPGTYLAKNVTVANQVRLEGASRSAVTLKLPVLAVLDGSPILNITVGGVVIQRLGFDGQRASQPADGFSDSYNGGGSGQGRSYRALIRAYNAGGEIVGLTVEDCLLQNAYGAAVSTQNVSHVKGRRNVVNNCNFEAFAIQSTYTAGQYLKGHDISNNEITNIASGDATVNGNAAVFNHASESIFANNICDTIERNAIKCEFCANTVIRGNVINNITVLSFGAIQVQGEGSNIVIEGNKITNAYYGIACGYFSPGTGYFNLVIANNTFDSITPGGSTPDGVTVDANAPASSGLTITGNTFRGIPRHAVHITGAWSKVVVSGNSGTTTGTATGGGVVDVVNQPQSGFTVANNIFDLGNIQTANGGVAFTQSGGNTIANVSISGNTVLTGASHIAFSDVANVITSGVFTGNQTDGQVSILSTNVLYADTNLIRSHNGWLMPSNGRVATASPVTVNIYDSKIITNLAVAGAVAVNLPGLGTDPNTILPGHTLLIKDGKGDAATNNITITRGSSTTIDGLTTAKVINTNGGFARLIFDGTNNWISS